MSKREKPSKAFVDLTRLAMDIGELQEKLKAFEEKEKKRYGVIED